MITSTALMNKAELVFLPAPGAGHLASSVEAAKILVDRDDRISITVLIMPTPFESNISKHRTASLVASFTSSRLRFVYLPKEEHDPNVAYVHVFVHLIETQKRHVKEAVSKLINDQSESTPESPRLAGFVLDMLCTGMVDVANEFGVPSYIFFTSAAAFLGFMFYVQDLHAEQKIDITEFKDSDAELEVPSLKALLPARVLPSAVFKKDMLSALFHNARFKESKGILVNTFLELESHALNSLSDGKTPPIYPVGPILNLKNDDNRRDGPDGGSKCKDIFDWLDGQPNASVVFLCFGSMGTFEVDQVKEIAMALERSGHRFLWSLRKPPPKGSMEFPGEYMNPQEALPEGFLGRTAGIGKVIGWAPQVAILAHPAIGGFVSHCGWNSTLESLWFGVPIATWPIYAEQQFNAFLLVRELGLAAEIKMDYRKDLTAQSQDIVSAEEIERGIRCLMEYDSEIRKRVMEMSDRSRKALMDGGSSHCSTGRLIQEVIDNMA